MLTVLFWLVVTPFLLIAAGAIGLALLAGLFKLVVGE